MWCPRSPGPGTSACLQRVLPCVRLSGPGYFMLQGSHLQRLFFLLWVVKFHPWPECAVLALVHVNKTSPPPELRPCDIPKLVDTVHSRLGKSSGEGAHHPGTQAAGLERRFHWVSGLGVIKVGTECGCCAVPSGCPVLTLRGGRGKRPFLYHQKGLSMNPVSLRHAWR